MSERENPSHSKPSTVWAPVALLVTLVGAAVSLALAGWEVEAIIGLLAALAGPGAVLAALLKSNAAQTATLAKIDHQVNGELDRRIRAAVEDALRAVPPHERGRGGQLPPPPRRRS